MMHVISWCFVCNSRLKINDTEWWTAFISLGFPKYPSRLTVVIKSMRDLMSDNHSYPAKVKSLVLLLAEERRLQDSCWKHWTEKNNTNDNTISKQDYNEEWLCYCEQKHLICHRGLVDAPKALTYLVSVGGVECIHHSCTDNPPEVWLIKGL